MFYIAICDDNVSICAFIEKVILEYGKTIAEEFFTEIFNSGEELYQDMKKGNIYDLILLDIELDKSSGIETGKKIREELKLDQIQIVFISAFTSYALELFHLRPMDFLIKPLEEDLIKKVVDKALELSCMSGQLFSYKKKRLTYKVLVKDILYFKSLGREIHMHMFEGKKIFYGSLEDVYCNLHQYRFFFCHKSYLINYNQIDKFEYERLMMLNGDEIPISQSKRKEVRSMQKDYEKGGRRK